MDATAARAAKGGLAGIVKVQAGHAASLDFPDDTFDFVVGTQVYCYVSDVGRAIQEAARVLRKGGRLVVLDSDWDFCAWAFRDAALTRRMVAARGARQFAHAHLPRELHRFFHGAGLTLAGALAKRPASRNGGRGLLSRGAADRPGVRHRGTFSRSGCAARYLTPRVSGHRAVG